MSYYKLQIDFYLNFSSLFYLSIRLKKLYIFKQKLILRGAKSSVKKYLIFFLLCSINDLSFLRNFSLYSIRFEILRFLKKKFLNFFYLFNFLAKIFFFKDSLKSFIHYFYSIGTCNQLNNYPRYL